MSDSRTNSFAAILRLFWDIVRLRRGPEDLPVSAALLITTIGAHTAVGLLIASVLPVPPEQPRVEDHSIALLLIDLAVSLLWGWAVLQAAARPERFLQTMTAMFGCQLVLQPLLIPAAWAAGIYGAETTLGMVAGLCVTAIAVWALVAVIRVLRAATDWSTFKCAALVVGQGVLVYVIALAVFPDLLKLK